MSEKTNIDEVVDEIKNSNEEGFKQIIEDWFFRTRTEGVKIGAQCICVAIDGIIRKHLKKGSQSSLRDYKRMTDAIISIISVPLEKNNTVQNDSEEETSETQEGEV